MLAAHLRPTGCCCMSFLVLEVVNVVFSRALSSLNCRIPIMQLMWMIRCIALARCATVNLALDMQLAETTIVTQS